MTTATAASPPSRSSSPARPVSRRSHRPAVASGGRPVRALVRDPAAPAATALAAAGPN